MWYIEANVISFLILEYFYFKMENEWNHMYCLLGGRFASGVITTSDKTWHKFVHKKDLILFDMPGASFVK